MIHPPSDRVVPYPLQWMESTFSTREAVQSLLSPHRETGLVSSHDFDLSVRFLPAQRFRQYQYPAACIGGALPYFVRRSTWSSYRTVILSVVGGIVGYNLGLLNKLNHHARFVRSIENPAGFMQAMDNIQKQLGVPIHGPILMVSHPKLPVDYGDDAQQKPPGDSDGPPMTPSSFESSQRNDHHVQQPVIQSKPASTWDQIRAANSKNAGNSSWDNIRQAHERSLVKSRNSPDNNSSNSSAQDDKAIEQARFDALLEKERNIK